MAVAKRDGDELVAALGIAVREQREALGWSQEDLGDEAGLHAVYVSGVERGVRNPTVRVVGQLAQAMGVDVSRLLKRAETLLRR